jgi:alkylated DNA repair dioxygenase AlkB
VRTRTLVDPAVVDLVRYPIDDLDSAEGRALVERCRSELTRSGAAILLGFLTPEATAEMVAIAGAVADQAWVSDEPHTVYFEPADPDVAASHPRRRQVRSAKRGIAYDRIPLEAPMRQLYESDAMTRFVAAVLGMDPLYRSADPLDAFQITRFEAGDELGWHFDRSEFSVTVMYQPSEEGGDFEYHPRLRSSRDPRYDAVEAALDEVGEAPATLPRHPGTLALFRGQHALHRVTPVVGPTPRLNSVLTYGERPDMRLNDLTSQLFYGRTSPA